MPHPWAGETKNNDNEENKIVSMSITFMLKVSISLTKYIIYFPIWYNSYMRVSDYFSLKTTQPSLDFVDVDLEKDVKLFVDPSALYLLNTEWGSKCRSLIKSFF